MRPRLIYWSFATAIFIFGCALRLGVWHPQPESPGFDEQVYVQYVDDLAERGFGGFSTTVSEYIVEVQKAEFVYLPPFRLGYTVPAWWLQKLTGKSSYDALRLTSALGSCLFALAGFFFAWRWLTPRQALAVLALLVCAPLQIHLAQYAFIDAVASLWAIVVVGCVWESLQQPPRLGWLVAAGVSFFLLCWTKQEIAVFVGVFLFVGLIVVRLLGWSPWPWRQAVVLAGSGSLALVALAALSGGFRPMLEAFAIYHERAQTLPYTILTGDGPWHRYLLEHLLINPLVFLLAVGFALRGDFSAKQNGFLLLFVVVTGVVMTSIRFGMNIRHTAMWDFPLALFAVQSIAALTARARWRTWWAVGLVALTCFTALRNYGTIFRGLYDTDLRFMLRAVRILK
jgi:4-amino-4-deoxy-L-arabinose transferase-like glycosyltransferase